jgi:tripeptidyl-peptidase-1
VHSSKPRAGRWASRDANVTFANLTCAQVVTPSCIQQSYGLPLDPATSPGNSITVTGYQSQFPQLDDLQVRRTRSALNSR